MIASFLGSLCLVVSSLAPGCSCSGGIENSGGGSTTGGGIAEVDQGTVIGVTGVNALGFMAGFYGAVSDIARGGAISSTGFDPTLDTFSGACPSGGSYQGVLRNPAGTVTGFDLVVCNNDDPSHIYYKVEVPSGGLTLTKTFTACKISECGTPINMSGEDAGTFAGPIVLYNGCTESSPPITDNSTDGVTTIDRNFSYSTDQLCSGVTVQVLDENGDVQVLDNGSLNEGEMGYTWDYVVGTGFTGISCLLELGSADSYTDNTSNDFSQSTSIPDYLSENTCLILADDFQANHQDLCADNFISGVTTCSGITDNISTCNNAYILGSDGNDHNCFTYPSGSNANEYCFTLEESSNLDQPFTCTPINTANHAGVCAGLVTTDCEAITDKTTCNNSYRFGGPSNNCFYSDTNQACYMLSQTCTP